MVRLHGKVRVAFWSGVGGVDSLASLPASLKGCIEALVHPRAQALTVERTHHQIFIAARLATSFIAIATAPLFLAFNGVPALWQAAAFFWMLLPLFAVGVLSRTGQMLPAQMVCVASLLGMSVTFATGGSYGVALAWLILVPIEAALSLNASAIIKASSLATTVALALYVGQANMWFAAPLDGSTATQLGLMLPAILYAATLAYLAIGLHHFHRRLERRGAARLRSLSEAIGDLVMRHDRTGSVLFASSNSENLFALAPRELMARGFFERVHVADRPAFLKGIADAAALDQTTTTHLRLRTGAIVQNAANFEEPQFAWVEMRARQIEAQPGNTLDSDNAAVISVVRDVTDRKRHEDEIVAARLHAEHTNVWKDRFLANVSHELRTPLNAIIGFSEMLGNDSLTPRDPAKRREYAEIIHASGQHLLSVVNTILDMSKIEAGNFDLSPEAFEVVPLIDLCCDIISLRAKEGGIELVREFPRHLEELVADKRACKQILINLLSNAVKFTPSQGRVTIGVRPQGNSMELFVADTGIGIMSRDLPKLGDAFFQAASSYDRAYEGTGLGLSVVRGLVGLHGGDIRIESAVGQGTCVTVRLPLDCRFAVRPTGLPAKIETISRPSAAGSAHIAFDLSKVKKSA